MNGKREINTRIFIGRVIQLLGQLYPSIFEALAQLIENAIDAGATNVSVVLDEKDGSKVIYVIDNGHGMIPYMLPEDEARLQSYDKDEANGEVPEGVDPTNVVPADSVSRRSLLWMVICIALSSRTPGDEKVRGMKGIGALAYLQYAGVIKVISLPSREIGIAYWGDEDEFPTCVLIRPTAEEMRRGINQNDIDISPEPLSDAWGKPMDHGTRVEVSSFLPGTEDLFNPNKLSAFFKSRFGGDIRSGRVALEIVDRTSQGVKRLPKGENVIPIKPAAYLGIPLFQNKVLKTPDGVEFVIEQLWYDPTGKGTGHDGLNVAHKGSPKLSLSRLPGFDEEPWTNVWGTINFPTYPHEDRLWDPAKTMLHDTPERRGWMKALQYFGRNELAPELASRRKVLQKREQQQYVTDLKDAALAGCGEVEWFKDLVITRSQQAPSSKKPKSEAQRQESKKLRATVFNEHNRGVPGIRIELWRAGVLVDAVYTGLSGSITFTGDYPNGGGYSLHMVIPDDSDIEPLPPLRYNNRTLIQGNGPKAVFRVLTGEDAPKRRLSGFTLDFTALDDPDRLYKQILKTSGMIVINSAHPDIAEAYEHDRSRYDVMLCNCIAAALTEYNSEGIKDPAFVLLQCTTLSNKILPHFLSNRSRSKRSTALKRAHRSKA